jgi:hypothetical protein
LTVTFCSWGDSMVAMVSSRYQRLA